jgi:hypothetical protein
MRKGKKYFKIVKGKKIYFGAKGYRIKPGTKYGDSYCARSLGINKKYPMTAINPNSPNNLSRRKWRCRGKISERNQ